jgi:hypothetical protein
MKRNESLKNFKNYCFWYSQANPEYPEIKCKFGKKCKYNHLTENEVNIIKEKGNKLIDCLYCMSKDVFYLESIDGRENIFPCPYNCKEGKIRLIYNILLKAKSREI